MPGQLVVNIVRLSGSVANRDYRLSLADGSQAVMKLGPANELAREAWACRRLAAMDLPVPSVLAYRTECKSLRAPALILSLVDGYADQDSAVVASAGAMMRRVHDVRLLGFGPLATVDGDWRGQHDSWAAAMAASVEAVPELIAAGVLAPELGQRAVEFAIGPLVRFNGDGVLLHCDLKEAHLFGVNGVLTGVIDWGDGRVGDPLLDLARMSMAPALFGAFLDGYGSTGSDAHAATLAAYRISWNLDALGYEYRAGGDWFETYLGRVAADVALLS